jgi:His-Xaa-Ser system protein HxsD
MSEPAQFVFENGSVHTTIDLRTYRLVAIKKAAYRLAARCTIALGSAADEHVPVTFTFKESVSESHAREVVRLFFEELLDQDLREHIAEETAPLRTLILAQAFSKTDLIRRE